MKRWELPFPLANTSLWQQKINSWGKVLFGTSRVALVVKNPPANAGDRRNVSVIPELGRSPGGGHGNPLQYSCLENPMNRGNWRATVHGVAMSWTLLKWLSTQHHDYFGLFTKFCQMSFIMLCLVEFSDCFLWCYWVCSSIPWILCQSKISCK